MFWENYVRLCGKVNKSPNRVAAEIGFKSPSVTQWKKGSVPRSGNLYKIADYFGVSVECLLEENDVRQVDLPERDKKLIRWFRALPAEKQKAILVAHDAPMDIL